MNIAESTDIIAKILHLSGVKHVVASSGSRSLRMVKAAADNKNLEVRMIVDERVAAFTALGISDFTSKPVALICTSGTAMLNYAPAIAEAYYRGIPLIVITADRPINVIDINDGQTIHQFHALDNIVKLSVDIDATKPCSAADFNLITNAISVALSARKGPIHINLHIEEGIDTNPLLCSDYNPGAIPQKSIPTTELNALNVGELIDKKIIIFVGQRNYNQNVTTLLHSLARRDNFAVIADIVSNCNAEFIIPDIESIIARIKEAPDIFAPDVVITMGKTSPLSRNFKEWLRGLDNYSHWRVNDRQDPEDTYFHLDKTIVCEDEVFLQHLVDNMPLCSKLQYGKSWQNLYHKAETIKNNLLDAAPWSDIYAIYQVMNHIPNNYNIECSNGMSIRYLSMIGSGKHPIYCNRGVNGIDGCTSTALGRSTVAQTPTLLITGDMSALYDISALYSGQLNPKFKMIILANCGGEIFRMIKATSGYKYREKLLCHVPDVKWSYVAQSIGMDYYEANNSNELEQLLPQFFIEKGHATLLVINTPAGNSDTYIDIIKKIHNKL